jgi:aminoglycoside phosphotransferase (APT) family kinase protein
MLEDKATEIRTGEELDSDKLQSFLQTKIESFGHIIKILQFPGGYSNLTYQIETKNQKYVLRKPPKGAENIKGGHNMQREYNILKSLQNANFKKIPKPILFSNDLSIIGSEFYLMEKMEGVILRSANFKTQKAELNPKKMEMLSINLCETLAQLHKIDLEKSGLLNLGKPEGYIERQVNGWFERYNKSKTDEISKFELVYKWLVAYMPKEIKPTLIHNDFKYDNVVINFETNKIIAILDWEMTTIGDPRMDIGTSLSYWCEPNDGEFEKTFNLTWLPGNLNRKDFVQLYQKTNPIDLSEILYFYVFGLFKNAIVIQQIYSRFKKGLTQDTRFSNLGYGVKTLIKKGLKSIESKKMK